MVHRHRSIKSIIEHARSNPLGRAPSSTMRVLENPESGGCIWASLFSFTRRRSRASGCSGECNSRAIRISNSVRATFRFGGSFTPRQTRLGRTRPQVNWNEEVRSSDTGKGQSLMSESSRSDFSSYRFFPTVFLFSSRDVSPEAFLVKRIPIFRWRETYWQSLRRMARREIRRQSTCARADERNRGSRLSALYYGTQPPKLGTEKERANEPKARLVMNTAAQVIYPAVTRRVLYTHTHISNETRTFEYGACGNALSTKVRGTRCLVAATSRRRIIIEDAAKTGRETYPIRYSNIFVALLCLAFAVVVVSLLRCSR